MARTGSFKASRPKFNKWDPKDMEKALECYNNTRTEADGPSVRMIARRWNVPRTTLRDRISGKTKSVTSSSGRKPVFKKEVEAELGALITQLAKQGFGLSKSAVCKLAYDYAKANKIPVPFNESRKSAGYEWLFRFMSRNPSITTRKPENLSSHRASGMNQPLVTKFFDDLSAFLTEKEILNDPKYIYNADELTGLQDHFEDNAVLASTTGRVFQITPKEKGETTTLLTAVNANGDRSPMLIIFKVKIVRKEWAEYAPPDGYVRCSEKGWITSELMVEFGRKFTEFIKKKRRYGEIEKEKTVLLLLDGHSTHFLNYDFIASLHSENIEVWCLPAHTSQYLQPLDKDVFSTMKRE